MANPARYFYRDDQVQVYFAKQRNDKRIRSLQATPAFAFVFVVFLLVTPPNLRDE
jgi:hypothetical protein